MQRRMSLVATLAGVLCACAFAWNVAPAAEEGFVLRVNAGSPEQYVDKEGRTWQGDRIWSEEQDTPYGFLEGDADSGVVNRGDIAIAGADDPFLYQTERYGMESFIARVPNGLYTVRLHFAETYPDIETQGPRVFNVQIEGETVLENLDISKVAEAQNRALIETFKNIKVVDGRLIVRFVRGQQNPEINAIEIMQQRGEAEAQEPGEDDLRKGRNFIPTKVYSLEEDKALLAKFDGLRVTDCTDGMDAVGLRDAGLMDPSILPLWKDTENFTHRIIGVAVTARYVPTNDAPPRDLPVEEFDKWVGQTYGQVTPEPFVPLLREGSVLVIEEAPDTDVGSIGSNNIMGWTLRGCIGVVSSSTARDTDEIITEKVPLYFRHPGRGIRPGRNEIESVNRPVVVGGVLVRPGDVIVADGDGVLCIPREVAADVADYAQGVLTGDKAGRRNLYEKLGLEPDVSVK